MIRFVILAMLVCILHSAHAAVSLSTLPLMPVDSVAAVGHNRWHATAITANDDEATPDLELKAITLRIETVVPNANLFVGVTTSQFFVPNMSEIVATMNVDPLILDPVLNTVSEVRLLPDDATPNPILTAGQTYWLVVGVTEPDPEQEDLTTGLYRWSYASSASTSETIVGWSIPSKIANAGTGGALWSPSDETPYSFGFEVTPIPEPTAVVWLTGLLAFAYTGGRRRR